MEAHQAGNSKGLVVVWDRQEREDEGKKVEKRQGDGKQ